MGTHMNTAATLPAMAMLKDRMALAMLGPPKIKQTDVARACGVDASTVNDWVSGRSKTIKGENLIAVARFLGVSPEWLATGRGNMRPSEEDVNFSPVRAGTASQTERIDPTTLGKAMKFARAYLAARGEPKDIEGRPHLVAVAYEVVAEIERTTDEADFIEALGRMTERLGAVEVGDDRRDAC